MYKTLLTIIVTFTTAMLLAGTAGAATYTVTAAPAGDGFYSSSMGTFVGNSNNINVSYFETSGGTTTETGYLQFDLSGAPPAGEISSVSLHLNFIGGSNYSRVTGRIKYKSNAGATGNASERIAGDHELHYFSYYAPSSNGWHSYNVTGSIKSDLENHVSWAPFSFHATSGGSYNTWYGFTFTSAESGTPAYLEFTYTPSPVPLPGALWLLGSGLLGLATIRRRQ